jgi:hypothetical protein
MGGKGDKITIINSEGPDYILKHEYVDYKPFISKLNKIEFARLAGEYFEKCR